MSSLSSSAERAYHAPMTNHPRSVQNAMESGDDAMSGGVESNSTLADPNALVCATSSTENMARGGNGGSARRGHFMGALQSTPLLSFG